MTEAKKPIGRTPFYGEKLTITTIAVTKAQHKKFRALGGNVWIREQIDKAPEPKNIDQTLKP